MSGVTAIRVATRLTWRDHLGSLLVRSAVGRMNYSVAPGLYAVGSPAGDSPVFVSANYKLSFDHLRKNLAGLDAWIMVLDTKGINVWCAAGKGTFGTDEIVRRAEETRLAEVVSHRRLILPQLGAPGVKGHEVTRRTGFKVVYGPVRARDIPEFLRAGRRATPAMRRVTFGVRDRAVLIPVEMVLGLRPALIAAAVLVLLSGFGPGAYSLDRAARTGPAAAGLILGSFLASVVLVPLLLPWLPGRAFSAKGAALGAALAGLLLGWTDGAGSGSRLELCGWILGIPALASFIAMNFTGASTYTSLSGVYREMRVAVPAQILVAAAGLGLWLTGKFVVI